MFLGFTVPPNSKETELRSSNREAFPSLCKDTGIVLRPCNTWKCVSTAISSGVDISEIHVCHEFSVRVTELFQGVVSHEFTAYFSVFNLYFNSMNYGYIIKRM